MQNKCSQKNKHELVNPVDLKMAANTELFFFMLAAQGRVGDIIDELFDINSEYLGFISSNLAKVRHWSYAGL